MREREPPKVAIACCVKGMCASGLSPAAQARPALYFLMRACFAVRIYFTVLLPLFSE